MSHSASPSALRWGSRVLAFVGLVMAPVALDAASRPVLALGFDGDFSSSNWAIDCASPLADLDGFGCGFLTGLESSQVNVAKTSVGDTVSLWTNSLVRGTLNNPPFARNIRLILLSETIVIGVWP